jgi:hypothetical protein
MSENAKDENELSTVQEAGAKGGKARAENMTADQRKEAARRAAQARWDVDLPQASHEGTFPIGETLLSAAVLPNGKRLLTQATFLRAIGRSDRPPAGTGIMSTLDGIPFFLQADVLKPFVTEDLVASTKPILFRDKYGGRSIGYDAELLPKVADTYLKYRDACNVARKPVSRRYETFIRACDILMRGLAHVGIVALVDEATGYQYDRAHDALAKILEAFVAKELRKWVKTFPPEFYQEMFRLRNKAFTAKARGLRYIGHLTNDLVYARLAPGVLAELRNKNPITEKGYRRNKHHQWLTDQVGHPKLVQHLDKLISMMKMFDAWDEFRERLDRALPKYQEMPLLDWAERQNMPQSDESDKEQDD